MASLYLEKDSECPYLDGELTRNLFFQSEVLSAVQFETLLERGWRHFGNLFFRPLCRSCKKCESLIVDIKNFKLSKSQKRVLSKNRDLKVELLPIQATQEHVDLVNLFQSERTEKKGWEAQSYTLESYKYSFVGPFDWSFELQIRSSDGALIGVCLMDFTPHSQSSVYFYSHPDWADRSLGTWSVLKEIEIAKKNHRSQLFMGLWNDECLSLAYKSKFKDHKLRAYSVPDDELLSYIATL